jgi:hypothetical protein
MTDDSICTELGCMSPAQVVRCAEASNTECWIAAKIVDEHGDEIAYECCAGGGKKARFSLLRRGTPPRPVGQGDVPDGLLWSRRMTS